MIKVAKAVALITCLGAILAVAVPASASQAMRRNRTIRTAEHVSAIIQRHGSGE